MIFWQIITKWIRYICCRPEYVSIDEELEDIHNFSSCVYNEFTDIYES